MTNGMAATHSQGKVATDTIFGANAAAVAATAIHGKENVVNATIGAFMDEEEQLACIPTVGQVMKNLPLTKLIAYAPIAGVPDYLKAVIDLTFSQQRPEAYIEAVATAGGSGAIHHTIWNYSEIGDTVLTSDWHWDPYSIFCRESMRKLDTYSLFDENLKFNIKAFSEKVTEILAKQNNLVVIINTPAHNPTGYSLTDNEWEQVIRVFKDAAKDPAKKIVPLIDIAYIEYAGEKEACRTFMRKLQGLPSNIMPILAFSMSKGYTLYGQRTGAMIGVSSNKQAMEEFTAINKFTSRATWSNINNGAMNTLATIYNDKTLLSQVEAERSVFYQQIRTRANIFTSEAKAADLKMLPYVAGFFLSIPAADPVRVCENLHKDNVFAVPLEKGVRIAVCAVTAKKITGMAGKIAAAMK
ncbi:aminotransferase class I/II-fold pyridoxal phosphate-dependent enzyme [Azotosporobacter soli]|uniref:aminotransferase class I/II-fold pyridoxal phosphate-dependent enzyme n=1 Tax=Azotosporobacter soli TaxID=3055040 RepID=UPI0031FE4958